jgi:hypothetical protein
MKNIIDAATVEPFVRRHHEQGGNDLMKPIFGPNTERVLVFLHRLVGLSAEQIDQVSQAWQQAPEQARAEGLAKAYLALEDQERQSIQVAASVARQTARGAAHRLRRQDWAFWAAAADAATAIAAADRVGVHYDTLVAPLAAVMPSLRPCEAAAW